MKHHVSALIISLILCVTVLSSCGFHIVFDDKSEATTETAETEHSETSAVTTKNKSSETTAVTTEKLSIEEKSAQVSSILESLNSETETEEQVITYPEVFNSNDGKHSLYGAAGEIVFNGKTFPGETRWYTTMGGYYYAELSITGSELPYFEAYDYKKDERATEYWQKLLFSAPVGDIYEGKVFTADELSNSNGLTGHSDVCMLQMFYDKPNTVLNDLLYDVSPDYDVTLTIEKFSPNQYLAFSVDYNGYSQFYRMDEKKIIIFENGDPVSYNENWSFTAYASFYYEDDYTDLGSYNDALAHGAEVEADILGRNTTTAAAVETEPACICGGSGICSVCRGSGTVSHYGHSTECPNCGGTGNCPYH